jgi:hypothetical protein
MFQPLNPVPKAPGLLFLMILNEAFKSVVDEDAFFAFI